MRLITRPDLDGLACGVLLSVVEDIREVSLVQPADLVRGVISVGNTDILANLPYMDGVGMWFDHHWSEASVAESIAGDFRGKFGLADSAARLVYEYYEGPAVEYYESFIDEVDRVDSARITETDVVEPSGWMLISYTFDSRLSNESVNKYFCRVLDQILERRSLEYILASSQVAERVSKLLSGQAEASIFLRRRSYVEGNVVVTDLRGYPNPIANRFLIFSVFPETSAQVKIFDIRSDMTVVAVSHNVFNDECRSNVGELLAHYGGGGHVGAGSVRLSRYHAADTISDIIDKLNSAKRD